MRINDEGLSIIKRFESFEPDWYRDPVGILTIGYGHVEDKRDGEITDEDLPEGISAPLTEKEANRLLLDDLKQFERCVERLVAADINRNEFSALVSFAYNVGCQALATSTLLELLNAGHKGKAAQEFEKWVYAGGNKLRGLVRRRRAERKLFESKVEDSLSVRPTPVRPLPPHKLPEGDDVIGQEHIR